MGLRIKLSITAQVTPGHYIDVNGMLLLTASGSNESIPAESFVSFSQGDRRTGMFEYVCKNTGLWGGYSDVSVSNPFWGIAVLNTTPTLVELALKSPAAETAPKDFTFSISYDDGATWNTVLTVVGATGYAPYQWKRWALLSPVTVGGNATTITGAPAEYVALHFWGSKELQALITPNAQGDWEAVVWPGEYSLTYYATGFKPVCHGPYIF